jgi:tetratricopeptide (TPR) repeat protein
MKFTDWVSMRLSRRSDGTGTQPDIYPLLQEASARLEDEQYDEARSVLLQLMESRSSLEALGLIDWVLTSLASTWLLRERYSEEIAFWSEYIGRYPGDSAAHRERGAAHWYSGRLVEAVRDYSRALELKPMDILSLSGRGQVLAEIGDNDGALEDLNRALQALKAAPRPGPKWDRWYLAIEAFVHNGMGLALAGLGESEMSMEQFDISITLSPENAWVYYNRAQVDDARGELEKARSDYRLALTKKDPALNPLRKERAESWLHERSNQP